MLAIRMQRTGRKGYPTYRVVVQDSHRQPTSGRVVANLGSYNPHTKESTLNKEKAEVFLKNGAQPSDRVVKLLQAEKVTLPSWVNVTSDKKQKTIRNNEKLRRNQPKEEKAEASAEPEQSSPETVVDLPVEQATEVAEPAVEEVKPEEKAEAATPAEATEAKNPEVSEKAKASASSEEDSKK